MNQLLLPYTRILEHYQFVEPPILLGGIAMKYYDLRECGHDLDMMISNTDKNNLLKLGYPLNLFGGQTERDVDSTFSNIMDLHLDLVITLNQYDYDFFLLRAIPFPYHKDLLIISLEDLLLTKIFAQTYSNFEKHSQDVKLIIEGIEKKNYPHLHQK